MINRCLNRRAIAGSMLLFAAMHPSASLAGVRTLHHFAGPTEDGQLPSSGVIHHDSILYGTTSSGGAADWGTIYKVNIDGTGYELLHEFAFNDGVKPDRGLTLGGSALYGATPEGTGLFGGTVYKINLDGTGFQVLHQFAEQSGSGLGVGPLLLDGSTVYGTTELGGSAGIGTVFKINIDGSGYQQLHTFAGNANDGAYPLGGLTLNGSTLYGTTFGGGDADLGTVFKINTSGTGFELLHEFLGGPSDGESPSAGLTFNGSALYGTTSFGGAGSGTIYKINIDGSGYELLHEFSSDIGEPNFPDAALALAGSLLYGTSDGGTAGDGTVFRINLDGTGFALLHEFSGQDGIAPSDLTLHGSTLFGTTALGGDGEGLFGLGTVFALSILPGDYSGDGTLGSEDYGAWRSAFGSSSPAADGNHDGTVDAADFVVWRKNVSLGSTPGGTGAAIPEPGAICFATILLAATAATSPHRPARASGNPRRR